MIEAIRTPGDRFENLINYPFEANYLEVGDGLRMHYLDEGPKDGPVVLLLHGEPSWSFLYRHMIPVFSANGIRSIVPDLIGFGKSDKPIRKEDYTYDRHYRWLNECLEQIEFKDATLFLQDWGGLLGLRLVKDMDARVSKVVVANTFLPSGQPANEAFMSWRSFSMNSPKFDIAKIINKATVTELSEEVLRGYNAPFPNDEYKAGARVFPSLVPIDYENPEAIKNQEYWKYLMEYTKPTLTLFSDSDPIMNGLEKFFQKSIPGAKDMPHEIIPSAGHFLQEDQGALIAEKVTAFMK